MLTMTRDAQCFEVAQMMRAIERTVTATARLDVVHFEPFGPPRRTPRTHRGEIGPLRCGGFARRPLSGRMAAPRAPVPVAPLCGAAREAPPVVGPEGGRAAIAAPGATSWR